MDRIPFLDLKGQYAAIKDAVKPAIDKVLDNTAYSSGPFVAEFEENFSKFSEVAYTAGCNSGTSALHLAMLALGVGPGDEVIIPANTFIATPWGPSYVGATPVYVDCDPDTWNIDPAKAEAAITDKTKAIIGVHLYGQPCEVDALKEICDRHGIFFVEDSAQAVGARYKGKRAGGLSEMGCFSFYPGKNLGAYGEAGAVTTDNKEYADKMNLLKNHGSPKKYYHDMVGYNMRMDGIQGAVLNVKLNYIQEWSDRRREIAKMYKEGVNNDKIKFQFEPDYMESVYHLMVITTEDRDGLMQYLNDNNIFPGMHYPVPCHLQNAYLHLGYKKGDMPHSEYLADHCISLPMFPELTDEQVNTVIEKLNAY